MPATSDTSPTRTRTPLSPRVTTARRGGHSIERKPVVQEPVLEAPVNRGVRVSPNAIIAPRGAVGRSASRDSGGFLAGVRGERRFAIR